MAIQAQELKVLEFRADMTMTDAVRFPKDDLNGDRGGLIRMGLVIPDASFEGDIITSEYKDGEWWIYMVKESNWITIKSKTHVPLRYEFEPIQSNYWSTSYYNSYQAKAVFFSNTQLKTGEPDFRYYGRSVRLVQEF